jgi:hypothetical protein
LYYFYKAGKGCYNDSAAARDLNGASFNEKNMTLDRCYYLCDINNFAFAGLQNGSYCYCGKSFGRYPKVNNAKCNCPCSGNKKTQCGCYLTNRIFQLKRKTAGACCKYLKKKLHCSVVGLTRIYCIW